MTTTRRYARGSKHPAAKLTEEHVREIRRSTKSKIELAADYGVSVSTISDIRNRATWTHVVP